MGIKTYFENIGLEADVMINVLFGGQPGQTVSMRSAIGAGYTPAGRTGPRMWFWCAVCWALNYIVQKNHCALQMTSKPEPGYVYVKAAAAFMILFLAIRAIVLLSIHLL